MLLPICRAGRFKRTFFNHLAKMVYPNKLKMRFTWINLKEVFFIMIDFELGLIQERFADIVWENEPIGSGDLVKICARELNWKKPTTYTVLRKLCGKGLLQNKNGVVTSKISREAFYSAKSGQVVKNSFHGSLPAFIAAFISQKDLTVQEADEIQSMINAFKKEG